MKCTTAAALICLATSVAAAPTPKPFIPSPNEMFRDSKEFNGESFYNGVFSKDSQTKDKFGRFKHRKIMVKAYKYEDALKWDGAGYEPYDWGFNWNRRPFGNGEPNQSDEDRKEEERKKKEEEERKKKEMKEEEERKKKEEEEKNKNNNKDQWKIKNFKRDCANGGSGDKQSKDKDCKISFEIEQPGKSSSKCEYKIDNLRASISNHKCNDNGNEYIIGAQWSDFFGADKGFTTLSVVDQKNKRIVWPAYSDTELKNGENFSPDKTYPSQEVPK